jgi:hypothetical protein
MFSEQDPKPTRAAFDVLVKILQGVENEELHFELRETLRDVYKAVSTQDPDLIAGLSSLHGEGRISVDEKLYVFVLLSVARTAGPYNLNKVREAFIHKNFDRTSVQKQLDAILMDATLKEFLQTVLEKL